VTCSSIGGFPGGPFGDSLRNSDRQRGALRVCLIHKDLSRSARVHINVGRRFAVASILRLTASSEDATTGVTLGGAAVDDFGGWAPNLLESIRPETMIAVEVPVASAALLLCSNS
jgi:hypothetical protein